MKQIAIISNKQCIYALPHKLPNDLKTEQWLEKKKKKMNGEENQEQQNNDQDKISTQEEISTLTAKRKACSISSFDQQPQSKMANMISTTPNPITNDDSISSTDTRQLAIDESKLSTDEYAEDLNTTDVTDATNVTRDLGLDKDDTSDILHKDGASDTSDNSDNIIESRTHPEEEVVEPFYIIESYTLKLPSVHDADAVKQMGAERETEMERRTEDREVCTCIAKVAP